MLTGDLIRMKYSKQRVVPLYIDRDASHWLEAAESLLLLYREGIGMTRGEIEAEVDELFGGGGKATQVHRGLAKVLEDRAEFEVVADIPPDEVRGKVFTAAAEYRRRLIAEAAPGPSPAVRSRRRPRRGVPRAEGPARGARWARSSPTCATRTACCGSRTSRPSG